MAESKIKKAGSLDNLSENCQVDTLTKVRPSFTQPGGSQESGAGLTPRSKFLKLAFNRSMPRDLYPDWYCTAPGCGHHSRYSRTVRKHLEEVHKFEPELIRREMREFFRVVQLRYERYQKEREGGKD